MSRFVSPNEMLESAKKHMLDGREPESKEDWMRIMNFMAANVHEVAAGPACRLMASIFNMPLTESEVNKIVEFQLSKKT